MKYCCLGQNGEMYSRKSLQFCWPARKLGLDMTTCCISNFLKTVFITTGTTIYIKKICSLGWDDLKTKAGSFVP